MPSKGKRSKSRKRKHPAGPTTELISPPPPELAAHLDIGLAAISRTLQDLSHLPAASGSNESSAGADALRYEAIFVVRSGHPAAFASHFPQMVAIASASPSRAASFPIRLVGLSKSCEERLSTSLGIPRVSSIGIRASAPQAKALIDFVRLHVPILDIPWLQEAPLAHFKETKITTVETVAGESKKKPKLS